MARRRQSRRSHVVEITLALLVVFGFWLALRTGAYEAVMSSLIHWYISQ